MEDLNIDLQTSVCPPMHLRLAAATGSDHGIKGGLLGERVSAATHPPRSPALAAAERSHRRRAIQTRLRHQDAVEAMADSADQDE